MLIANPRRAAIVPVPNTPAQSATSSGCSEIHAGRVERILVVRFGAFGDMVLMTPMLQRLRQRFDATIDILGTGAWTAALLQQCPGIGEIHQITGRRVPYALSYSQQAAVRWLRERGPTPTWFCQPDPGSRHLLQRAGVPHHMTCEIASIPKHTDEHAAKWWLRFADETPQCLAHFERRSLPHIEGRARLHVTTQMRAALRTWLQEHGLWGHSLVLIQAGNKRTMRALYRNRRTNTKFWPEERWAHVIRAIREHDSEQRVVLLGSKGEHSLNEEIRACAGVPHVYNVARNLPIEILLPLLEVAHSMITVDTGPAHAAAALGCPQITLFGEANPARYFPGGEGTDATVLTGELGGRPNMLGIPAASVIEAWIRLRSRASR